MRHRPKVQEKIWEKKVLNKHKYWKQLVRKKKTWSKRQGKQAKKETTTNKIVTDISTAPKEKVKTRCQIWVKRLGTVKWGQLKNNKYEDQKALEPDGQDEGYV